jgi:precorrin-2 dehydrogenase/sirohydrochlorin ferrochelatase
LTDFRSPTYPVNLRLAGLRVLVVGAGKVALRKVEGLLAAGADVTVVAPDINPEIQKLADQGRLALRRRPYASADLNAIRLVFVATGRPEVDRSVAREARQAGLLINVADVPELCSFYLPAILRRGHLQLAIATDGAAPFVSRRFRQWLENLLGGSFAAWLSSAEEFRDEVLASVAEHDRREALFDRFFRETLHGRVPGQVQPAVPDAATWRRWIEGPRPRDSGEPAAGDPTGQ